MTDNSEEIKNHYSGILDILNSYEEDNYSKTDLDKIIKHAEALSKSESESKQANLIKAVALIKKEAINEAFSLISQYK